MNHTHRYALGRLSRSPCPAQCSSARPSLTCTRRQRCVEPTARPPARHPSMAPARRPVPPSRPGRGTRSPARPPRTGLDAGEIAKLPLTRCTASPRPTSRMHANKHTTEPPRSTGCRRFAWACLRRAGLGWTRCRGHRNLRPSASSSSFSCSCSWLDRARALLFSSHRIVIRSRAAHPLECCPPTPHKHTHTPGPALCELT